MSTPRFLGLDKIPEAAVRIHLYPFKNVLRPRGGIMEKESVSLSIMEHCEDAFESWTDPKYGDSRPVNVVIDQIISNLEEEVNYVLAELRSRRTE